MGKKRRAYKQPSTADEKHSKYPTTIEVRPPSPQQSQPAPTPQIPAMVLLDALAAYLRQHDPNRDWTATLAGFSQGGGAPSIPTPTPEISTTTIPTPASEKPSKPVTAPTESATHSPMHQQIEPLDVIPLSAYQDPGPEEEKEKGREEEKEISEEDGEEKMNES